METTQGFFFSFLQLPYDAHYCPVDVFINLDSLKEMNGLSYYSHCLELVYDRLVLAMLSHRFYIPMDSNTLCVDFLSLMNNFPSLPSSYGLLVQSSLYPSELSYYHLNSIFKLLPGKDGVTMSLGFSRIKREKVGVFHSVEIAVLDSNFVSPVLLQNNQMSFTGSAVIFNNDMYITRLRGTGSTTISWINTVISLQGWFPREEMKFLSELEKTVQQNIQQIASRASTRFATASSDVSSASDGLSTAQAALDDAQGEYGRINQEYQDRTTERNRLRVNLETAEGVLQNATDELEEAKSAVDNLCTIQTCPQACMETTRTRIVTKDIYQVETLKCDAICTHRVEVPVPRFRFVRKWAWRSGCWTSIRPCGQWNVCEYRLCTSRCTPYYEYVITHFDTRTIDIQKPCTRDCTRRVFVRSERRTVMETVPCGRMVPEAMCARSNQLCSVQRTSAYALIDEKRQDLTRPLRIRNTIQRDLAIAENRLLKSSVARDRAQDKIDMAQGVFDQAERRRNASIQRQQEIQESDETGHQINELLKRTNSNISYAFTITNISFTVTHSTTTVPHNFPIDITYTTEGTSAVLRRRYNFKTDFLAQKDSIINSIVSDIVDRRDGSRQKRNAHEEEEEEEEEERSGEREFQGRCVQLKSLSSFIQNMNETLMALNSSRTKTENELQATFTRFLSINSSLTASTGNFYANYTTIQETFNISFQDFNRFSNQTESGEEDEVSSLIEVLQELILNTRDTLASVESDYITEWKNDLETSLETNYTLGNSICYGLRDCLVVFNSELQNMLNFAPDIITGNFQHLIPVAMDSLLIVPNSVTFNDTFTLLRPMIGVISRMNRTGYWCAQPPTIVTHPPNFVNTSVGSTLVLSCDGQSSLPLSYQWRKDGVTLSGAKNSTFILHNMRVFDEGNYTCDITNNVATVTTTNASIRAFQLPLFYLTPVSIVTYTGSDNGALFTCNATSRPDPGWKWFHKRLITDQWKEIEGEETNELFISRPIDNDIGWYICMAVNYHGNISSDPVYLRLVTVSVRVNALPVKFTVRRVYDDDDDKIGRRGTGEDGLISSTVLKFLQGKALINSTFVQNLTITTSDDGQTYQVSFYLLSQNTTVNDTGMKPLDQIARRLQIAVQELNDNRDRLRDSINNNNNITTGSGSVVYSPLRSSYTVQFTNILCPNGQELHSSTFLCSKFTCNL